MISIKKFAQKIGPAHEEIEPTDEELYAFRIILRLAGLTSDVTSGWGNGAQHDNFWKIVPAAITVYKRCCKEEELLCLYENSPWIRSSEHNNDAFIVRQFLDRVSEFKKESKLSLASSKSEALLNLDVEDRKSMDMAIVDLTASKIEELISLGETMSSRALAGSVTGASLALYDEAVQIKNGINRRSYVEELFRDRDCEYSTLIGFVAEMDRKIVECNSWVDSEMKV